MPADNFLSSLTAQDLLRVLGGASRVTARSSGSSDQLTLLLTQVTSSLKDLGANKNQSDPTQLLLMLMMMGGLGGGGGGAQAAAPMPAPAPEPPPMPQINISTNVRNA